MDVFEAIHNRHSIKKVKQDAVPRERIETLLDAAVQAPVLQGDGREAGDLIEHLLELEHELHRALGGLGILQRVQGGESRYASNRFIDARIELHRA